MVGFRTRPGLYQQKVSQACKSVCVCVCVDTGVEILRHVTAGGPMPTRKDGAEKEMTVAMVMPSWSGWWSGSVKLLPAETMRAAKKQWKPFTFIIIIMKSRSQKYAWWRRHVPSPTLTAVHYVALAPPPSLHPQSVKLSSPCRLHWKPFPFFLLKKPLEQLELQIP